MSMQAIRDRYGVPAKRGGIVRFTASNGVAWTGRIRSARDGRLRVELPGFGRIPAILHPTWHVEYL